jgi:hypothetical protein
MKLIIQRLEAVHKTSTMSEGVAELRINNQPCKGINMIARHMWATEATRVAIVHDVVKESGRVLPCPSAGFDAYASVGTLWVARALSHCTPVKWGTVSSNPSAHETTKFRDSICPVCVSGFKCLFIDTQPMQALTDTGEGYYLGALNFRSDHSSSFPSNILPFPLIALPDLQLCQYFDHLAKPHRTSISRKGPIMSGFQPLNFYHLPIQLSTAYYHCLLFHRCKQSGLVRVFLVQLRFHQAPILKSTIMT